MRILISGGGTAGHVNPAIAIANYLKRKNKNITVEFAGTERGIESKLVRREGYKLHCLKVQGFQRKFTLKNINTLIMAFTSKHKAKEIIKEFKPDVVVGTGGYVSWPVLSVAAKMKIPTVIHEQNAFPGVTTKMLAGVADKVMISFKESENYFKEKDKLIYTGNPVKEEFFSVNRQAAKRELSPNYPLIISYGGSMGAKPISNVMIEFMERYSKNKRISHFHATGSGDFAEINNIFEQKGLNTYSNLKVIEYFYDMPKYMAAADVVIGRAGAMTLAELAALKKPAILIPSPYVTENHQYKNAVVLENAKAAVVVEEKDLTCDFLMAKIEELVNDPFTLNEMSVNMGKFAMPDTLEKMYGVIMETYKERKK